MDQLDDDDNRRYRSRRKSDISLFYRYKMLTESVELGLFECNNDDEIEYSNSPLFTMFETTKDELLGKVWMDALRVPQIDTNLWEAYKNKEKSFSFDYQVDIGGTPKWFVIRIEPIREPGMGAIGTVTDITVEKTLLKELLELKARNRRGADGRNVAARK